MTETPEQLVQRQLDAYNNNDLEAFMATYSPTIRIVYLPTGEVDFDGANAVRETWGRLFAEKKAHVDLIGRIVQGNFIIDHELIPHNGNKVVAIYEVKDGLIQRMWTLD